MTNHVQEPTALIDHAAASRIDFQKTERSRLQKLKDPCMSRI